jgi:pimeloyl-ACP methyl ester carboxylesterase
MTSAFEPRLYDTSSVSTLLEDVLGVRKCRPLVDELAELKIGKHSLQFVVRIQTIVLDNEGEFAKAPHPRRRPATPPVAILSEGNRNEICRLLWNLWSPNWSFDDSTFEASARSFENPDFVEVSIQSYRQRYGNAAGDPGLEPIERVLEEQPSISVPTIVLHGAADGVAPPESSAHHARHLTSRCERRVIRSPDISFRAKHRLR